MNRADRDKRVDRLLHDADYAESGERTARAMRDYDAANRLKVKAARLRSDAERIDPNHEAAAWDELG